MALVAESRPVDSKFKCCSCFAIGARKEIVRRARVPSF